MNPNPLTFRDYLTNGTPWGKAACPDPSQMDTGDVVLVAYGYATGQLATLTAPPVRDPLFMGGWTFSTQVHLPVALERRHVRHTYTCGQVAPLPWAMRDPDPDVQARHDTWARILERKLDLGWTITMGSFHQLDQVMGEGFFTRTGEIVSRGMLKAVLYRPGDPDVFLFSHCQKRGPGFMPIVVPRLDHLDLGVRPMRRDCTHSRRQVQVLRDVLTDRPTNTRVVQDGPPRHNLVLGGVPCHIAANRGRRRDDHALYYVDTPLGLFKVAPLQFALATGFISRHIQGPQGDWVVWGDRNPYLPTTYGQSLADALRVLGERIRVLDAWQRKDQAHLAHHATDPWCPCGGHPSQKRSD